MPNISDRFVRSEILRLLPYHVPPSSGMIKLDAMENPYSLPDVLRKEIAQLVAAITTNRYPDSSCASLKAILCETMEVPSEMDIILGNGSDEIIQIIALSLAKPGAILMSIEPSFIMFRMIAAYTNMKYVGIPLRANFELDLDFMLEAILKHQPAVIFIAYPNNPTGTYLNRVDMMELRKKLRSDILLVVDDAYCEYIKDPNFSSGIKLFSKSRNVLITRTFSKIYGLAGLRIGWGYSSKEIIQKLYEIKPPFNVSRPALFAATQAVQDIKWLDKAIKHNNYWSEKIFEVLYEIGVATNRTNVNFFLLNFDFVNQSASKVFNKLANSGILVRQMDVYGIKNSLRVTIGNSKENKKFISVLRRIFNV